MDRPTGAYLQLLRLIHPDRFAIQGIDSPAYLNAVAQTAWINESLDQVSRFSERCDYFLKKYANLGKKKIPMEWAEEWFSLQDLDIRVHGKEYVEFFERLKIHQKQIAEQMLVIAAEVDASRVDGKPESALLGRLSDALNEEHYCKSLSAQVESEIARNA